MISALAQWWDGAKMAIQTALYMGRDAPHGHAGLVVMVALLFLCRGRWPVLCWGLALLAEIVNELLDLSWAGPESSLAASGHDLVVTAIPPTILLIAILNVRRHQTPAGLAALRREPT